MGRIHYFLRIETYQMQHGIFIIRRKLATDILKMSKMDSCMPISTLLEERIMLKKKKGTEKLGNSTLYKLLTGSLTKISHIH